MKDIRFLLIIVLLIVSVGASGYLGYQTYTLNKTKQSLENQLAQLRDESASSKVNLESIITATQQKLNDTESQREFFEFKYNEEKNKMDFLSSQISGIQGQVGLLEKLKQIDPELLKKYSKVYFLNENYTPKEFTIIEPQYASDPQKTNLIYTKVWPFLSELLITAESDGIKFRVISAYRSFNTQSDLKASYKMTYGSGANRFSADQGYSEHQLGTTVDFTTADIGANFTTFDETTGYQWLLNNAYKYGFIISYPESNQYYQFEPWHWRFVGRALAEKMRQDNRYFYDMDQHEIDGYLISLFD